MLGHHLLQQKALADLVEHRRNPVSELIDKTVCETAETYDVDIHHAAALMHRAEVSLSIQVRLFGHKEKDFRSSFRTFRKHLPKQPLPVVCR